MWLIKTKKEGTLEAPRIRFGKDILFLENISGEIKSYEIRDWKKLWLEKKTITGKKDFVWTFYCLNIEQFVSATWIVEKEAED